MCLIDYQWSGVALGATDVIYLLATAASDDFLHPDMDIREEVLRPYFAIFTGARRDYRRTEGVNTAADRDNDSNTVAGRDGVAASIDVSLSPQYTFEDLEHDFSLAVLDWTRWAVTCRLGGETPEKFTGRREANDPNLGAYRSSERVLRFIFELVLQYLPAVEKEMATH